MEKSFEEVVRDESAYDLNFRLVRPDGMIRHIHSVGRPLFDRSGTLTEVIGSVMDVTERKQAAEDLRKAQAELAHISRISMLGAMVDSIAHELNQPLAAISAGGGASLRWLEREIPDLKEARRAVELMVENALRAGEVINKIRSLGRTSVAQEESLDVNAIIRDVVALADHELTNNGVALNMELQPGVSRIQGDRIQLQQVVLNLILNGNDAMSAPGWPVRELTIRSEQFGPDEVVVSVQDSGCGVSASDAEHIFDPLFSTKTVGLGLGLWISRRIVEAHGGRIWATHNAGGGATLHFALPVGSSSDREI